MSIPADPPNVGEVVPIPTLPKRYEFEPDCWIDDVTVKPSVNLPDPYTSSL